MPAPGSDIAATLSIDPETALATRSDLPDRSILLYLPEIKGRRRRPEADLLREFEAARAKILGALLDLVVRALRTLPSIRLAEMPRMADFAAWGAAAAGDGADAFLRDYERNRAQASEVAIETSPVAEALLKMVKNWPADQVWEGTATELLTALGAQVGHLTWDRNTWPRSAQGLSTALRRLKPNLRRAGVLVEFGRASKAGTRVVFLRRG